MNDNKEFELLSDLAKLIRKYGPDTFEGLAHALSKPDFIDSFTEVLRTAAKFDRNTRRTAVKRSSNYNRIDFRSSLERIAMDETEKGKLLIDLYDGLQSKTLLPTLKEMQNFALDNGLPPVKATSRAKAIVPFIKAFLPMPVQDLREYVKRIQSNAPQERGLEGWSDIIFGDKK